jgi:signal transduction histidine kinase/CheY-like chemotaxis protein
MQKRAKKSPLTSYCEINILSPQEKELMQHLHTLKQEALVEGKWQLVPEAQHVFYLLIDDQQKILSMAGEIKADSGLSILIDPKISVGDSLMDHLLPAFHRLWGKAFNTCMHYQKAVKMHPEVEIRDSYYFPYEITINPLIDKKEKEVHNYIIDFKHRKIELAEESALSRQLFDIFADKLPISFFQFLLEEDGKTAIPFISKHETEGLAFNYKTIRKNGTVILESIHPDDKNTFFTKMKLSSEQLTPFAEEIRFIRDSNVYWRYVYGLPEKKDKGTLWNGYILDISELRASQLKRKEDETFFLRMINSAQVGILHIDQSGNILFANNYAKDLLNLKNNGNNNIYDYLHFNDIPSFINNIKNKEWGEYVPLEAKVLHQDRNFLWMNIKFSWLNPDDKNSSLILSLEDLSFVKDLGESLMEAESRWNSALEYTEHGVWDWSIQNNQLFLSTMFVQIIHRATFRKDLTDWQKIDAYIHPDDLATIQKNRQDIRSGKISQFHEEFRLLSPKGEVCWISNKARIFSWKNNKTPARIIGAISDINLERTYQETLAQAKNEAERANKHKSLFLANMSHEIRTPMNGVIGALEALKYPASELERQELLDIALQSSRNLLSLLNDILDLSKIDAEKLKIQTEKTDIIELLGNCIKSFQIPAQKKHLRLTLWIEKELYNYRFIEADSVRLQQIFNNLLSNAIKFTDKGEVSLSAHLEAVEGDHCDIHFNVRDSGRGIPEAMIEKIFLPFEQAEQPAPTGGTGLGLSICRSLVSLMKGHIFVESQENIGSIFSVQIPFIFHKEQKLSFSRQNFEKKKFILFADNICTPSPLVSLFEGLGITYRFFDTIYNLIRYLENHAEAFDGIFLDSINPEKIVSELQLQNYLAHLGTIFWVSSYAHSKKERSHIDFILQHPLTANDLLTSLDKAFSFNNFLHTSTIKSIISKKHILLAEDNPINQKVALALLKRQGYQITFANDGAAAVALYVAQSDLFNIILMDLEMPKMGGIEATKQIRTWEKQNKKNPVPIIALTAHAFNEFRDNCLSSGMNDFLTKPLRAEMLYETIERWSKQQTNNSNQKTTKTKAKQNIPVSLINKEQALELLGGDLSLYQDIIKAFLASSATEIAKLEQYAKEQDLISLAFAIHGFKSSLAHLGAENAAKLAAQIEQNARTRTWEEQPFARLKVMVDLIQEELRRIVQE